MKDRLLLANSPLPLGVSERVEDAPGHFAIIERDGTVPQNLIRLVTFSRQDDDVAGFGAADGRANGALTVGLRDMRRIKAAEPYHRVVHDRGGAEARARDR